MDTNKSKKVKTNESTKAWVVLGAGAIALFSLVFLNYSLKNKREGRDLASQGLDQEYVEKQKDFNEVIANNLETSLKHQSTSHSEKPTAEDQFLFGYLKGDYTSFNVKGSLASIKLKEGSEGLSFSEEKDIEELIAQFKKTFYEGAAFTKINRGRGLASQEVSYFVDKAGHRKKVTFILSAQKSLVEIKVEEL